MSLAPRARMIGSRKSRPRPEKNRPSSAPARISRLKLRRAPAVSPPPILRAISALPPVPSMVPRPQSTPMAGLMMLMAESASVFTKRATKITSTIVYRPLKTIMTMVGKAKRSRERRPETRSRALAGSRAGAAVLVDIFKPGTARRGPEAASESFFAGKGHKDHYAVFPLSHAVLLGKLFSPGQGLDNGGHGAEETPGRRRV